MPRMWSKYAGLFSRRNQKRGLPFRSCSFTAPLPAWGRLATHAAGKAASSGSAYGSELTCTPAASSGRATSAAFSLPRRTPRASWGDDWRTYRTGLPLRVSSLFIKPAKMPCSKAVVRPMDKGASDPFLPCPSLRKRSPAASCASSTGGQCVALPALPP